MGKIATEREAYNLGNHKISHNDNKCCTYARAKNFGCKINGSYKDNQLVQLEDLSEYKCWASITFTLYADSNVDYSQFDGINLGLELYNDYSYKEGQYTQSIEFYDENEFLFADYFREVPISRPVGIKWCLYFFSDEYIMNPLMLKYAIGDKFLLSGNIIDSGEIPCNERTEPNDTYYFGSEAYYTFPIDEDVEEFNTINIAFDLEIINS